MTVNDWRASSAEAGSKALPSEESPGKSANGMKIRTTLELMAMSARLHSKTARPGEGVSGSHSPNDQPDARLFKAEARYRTLVEQIPAITFIASLDGSNEELYVSPQIEALLGWTAEEWLETPTLWFGRLHPDDRKRWQEDFSQLCLFGMRFGAEYRLYRRDGRMIWVRGEAQVVRDADGMPIFIQGIVYDITERKGAEEVLRGLRDDLEKQVRERTAELAQANEVLQAEVRERKRIEEEVRQNEERYRLLFERNPHPLFVYDPQTLAYLAVNDAAVEQYGYSREEFLRMTLNDIRPPEDVPAVKARLSRMQPAFERQGVWRHRKKDGTLIEVEISTHQIRFGDRPACIGLAVDVTERKRLEEQLRQSQKMEGIGRLAGGVAHDFNNLLTVINGCADMAVRELQVDNSVRDLISEIRKAGERAAGLTRQLLMFSRKQVLAPRNLDLNTVISELEKLLYRLIGEDIELLTRLEREPCHVFADRGQLEQMIVNLSVNARDAMPRGGMLVLETRRVVVREERCRAVKSMKPGDYVMLSVTDSGCGMSEEVLSRIFEPFFTTKGVGVGTGLGLAVVHGIVQQSEGHIEVESKPGAGTTFRIYLPRVKVSSPSGKSNPGITTMVGGSETVLLVEDEEAVRSLTRLILQQGGYRVLEASNGEEALDVLAEYAAPIDLLVTDVVMPGLGGRELAERLLAGEPDLRILYLSGYTDDAVVRNGVLRDQVHFLQKPFTPAAFSQKVREVLDLPKTDALAD